jgi:hypothetical protein
LLAMDCAPGSVAAAQRSILVNLRDLVEYFLPVVRDATNRGSKLSFRFVLVNIICASTHHTSKLNPTST